MVCLKLHGITTNVCDENKSSDWIGNIAVTTAFDLDAMIQPRSATRGNLRSELFKKTFVSPETFICINY